MKISIKVSIITLFTTILVLTGSTLIFLNYATSHNILLTSAEYLIKGSSSIIEENINSFLVPAESRTKVAANLIADKIIIPEDTTHFYTFLIENLIDLPGFSGAYWSDSFGNAYIIERSITNTLFKEKVQNLATGRFITSEEINYSGRTLSKPITSSTEFNPATRPWYTQAVTTRSCTTSDIYQFYPFGKNQAELGVTYACPIYDNHNIFMGVFAIDLRLSSFSDFVSKIIITPNTNIFIFDNKHNVIATNKQPSFPLQSLLKVRDLNLPWFDDLLQSYGLKEKTVFTYKFNEKDYLTLYKPMHIIGGNDWFISIVIPLGDIASGLNARLMLSIAVAGSILIIGLFLAWLAAHALSRPIIKLADETGLVRQLEINFVSKLKSHIKEIIYMQDAINAMKKSLQSFARYVPITLVKRLMASGDVANVGGENRSVTFLFSDISGFTSISEHINPEDLMNYLSEYFKAMSKIILQNKGTIDKYIGDAIMAFWNAPLEDPEHATNACNSALRMLEVLASLNQEWKQQGKPELVVRIGINTGKAVIGNVGSEDRLSYTAIGDSVNLTNRIEELNKFYKSTIIVSSSSYQLVKDKFNFRLIDNVTVRGREEGVLIYELLPQTNMFGERLDNYNTEFKAAFNLYQQKQWSEAAALFTKLSVAYPQDNLTKIFVERCHTLILNPPDKWNGIWRFQ